VKSLCAVSSRGKKAPASVHSRHRQGEKVLGRERSKCRLGGKRRGVPMHSMKGEKKAAHFSASYAEKQESIPDFLTTPGKREGGKNHLLQHAEEKRSRGVLRKRTLFPHHLGRKGGVSTFRRRGGKIGEGGPYVPTKGDLVLLLRGEKMNRFLSLFKKGKEKALFL